MCEISTVGLVLMVLRVAAGSTKSNPYVEFYVHPQYGHAILNIDCGSR